MHEVCVLGEASAGAPGLLDTVGVSVGATAPGCAGASSWEAPFPHRHLLGCETFGAGVLLSARDLCSSLMGVS